MIRIRNEIPYRTMVVAAGEFAPEVMDMPGPALTRSLAHWYFHP